MRVLIFEPQFAGHNLAHAARLVRAVTDLGCQPVLATSTQAAESTEFDVHLGPDRGLFELVALPGFQTDPLGRRLRTSGLNSLAAGYRSLTRAVRDIRPDHVYLPCGNLLARFGWLPLGLGAALRDCGAEAETLLVSGRYLLPRRPLAARLRQRLVLRMIAAGPWTRVLYLNDATQAELTRHGGRITRTARLAPDPFGQLPDITQSEARTALGVPANGRAVAVVGLIEGRKGIAVLAQAMRDAADRLQPDDRLLLLGSFHPDVHTLLHEQYADLLAAGRVVCVDRRLSSLEFGQAIRSADVVAAVCPHHAYTASTVVAGAAARRPLLGSANGWIGRTIRRFELGRCCDAANPASVADALVATLDASATHTVTPAAERFVRYSSDANYAAHWTARLRERCGLAPSPDLLTWEWALHGEEFAAAASGPRVEPPDEGVAAGEADATRPVRATPPVVIYRRVAGEAAPPRVDTAPAEAVVIDSAGAAAPPAAEHLAEPTELTEPTEPTSPRSG
ncbi:MAG: hypothetical protein AAF790_02865 [Planctomycetota bacterium]